MKEPGMSGRAVSVNENIKARFSGKVKQDASGCHVWTGATDRHGYGQLRIRPRLWLAHRLAYTLAHGDIPKKMCVLHRCDNPACVNPEHLFLGTQADNLQDMRRKRRGANGSKARHAKLTDAAAIDIRRRYAAGELQRELAAEYGVTQPTISALVNQTTWKHLEAS